MTEARTLLMQNQQLHEEIKRKIAHITAINTVAATISTSLDLNITLDTALKVVTQVVDAEAAGISLIDEQANEIVLRAQLGWLQDFVVDNPMRIPLGRGMSGAVIAQDHVVVHNNLDEHSEYAVPSFRDEHFRSIAMAPMHARGRIIGILSIMSHKTDRFDDDVVAVLGLIADTIGVAIDNARLYETQVESENRLKAILYSTADGIIATDQSSHISLVNHAAAVMLDVEVNEVLGVPLREAAIQSRVRDKLLLALAPDADEIEKSFQVSLENGKELSVLVSPVQIQTQVAGNSALDGWVIVLQDITHIHEAEIARVHFIQAAAHDMKNPLSVTQSSINMLSGMLDESEPTVQEVARIAQTGITRLRRLIDDLLQIEKIESGYDFNRDDVDVREMCYEISAQIKPMMQEQNTEFIVNIMDDVPRSLWIDREWVTRALQNSPENAAKYGGENGHIQFRAFTQAAMVHFEISDNGIGIPLRAQSRIFDRFYRVEERRDVKGSGLGLAIVKSVAEAHGGTAYVKSREGQGSTFGLNLPINGGSSAAT